MEHLTEIKVPQKIIDHFIKVYIHPEAKESPLGKRIIQFFPASRIEWRTSPPFSLKEGDHLSADDFDRSKRHLFLTPFLGRFFKRCPGAKPGLTCCNYFVLTLGLQCPLNCSYCYLQSYLNNPVLTVYSNIDQALHELELFAEEQSHYKLRIGTGETIDSLALDPLTLHSRDLISFFQKVPQWRLELKTKSAYVDQFLDLPHKNNIIVSWSLNPQHIIEKEEKDTASLEERLSAARKCRDQGHLIAFHLDPLIYHPEWKKNYTQLVESISQYFKPHEILNITLGALRFQPEQRHIMRERWGLNSYVTRAEMFRSEDGKFRYDQEVRQEMFQWVLNQFRSKGSWNVFLCMETKESWMGTWNSLPKSIEGLEDYFDRRPIMAHQRTAR